MQLIDGKAVSETIISEIKEKVDRIIESGNRTPKLTAIIVGNDPASETYVGHKEKACAKVGFHSNIIKLPEDISQKDLKTIICDLNTDPSVDGIIVQLPLPKHIDEQLVIETIEPCKDVDGFHPTNVGKMAAGLTSFISATPYGILTLLERYKIETAGKHCVVIGRSNIVGRPIS
ncbi:MAG: bifunctional 5,10-methylenetetrahydrofolate dehydrogenase/5,10-methenyltetrahydrofolate cyclohydrolase, partial [Bacteroidales bacterium]|nr:bifunctional 5,10-methylenetetrahydrofolate dehydrogenase/5,10-methenyltetrahydrofolate cyclohydrolase [Bacteroidales bacterium]